MLRTITRCFGRHLWLAGTVLVMAVWTLRLLALHYTPNTCYAITCNNYISDQVGAQNLIADWQQGFRQASDLGPQMDFLKYPLYLAVNNLPIEPLKQLFIESWLILAVTAALVLRAMELVFGVVAERTATPKRLPVSMLVCDCRSRRHSRGRILLVGVPGFPQCRNRAVRLSNRGLSLYLTLTGHGPRRRTWLTVWYIALAACLFASDPLFLYGVGIPVVAVSLLYLLFPSAHRAFIPPQRLFRAVGATVVAAACSRCRRCRPGASAPHPRLGGVHLNNLRINIHSQSPVPC